MICNQKKGEDYVYSTVWTSQTWDKSPMKIKTDQFGKSIIASEEELLLIGAVDSKRLLCLSGKSTFFSERSANIYLENDSLKLQGSMSACVRNAINFI